MCICKFVVKPNLVPYFTTSRKAQFYDFPYLDTLNHPLRSIAITSLQSESQTAQLEYNNHGHGSDFLLRCKPCCPWKLQGHHMALWPGKPGRLLHKAFSSKTPSSGTPLVPPNAQLAAITPQPLALSALKGCVGTLPHHGYAKSFLLPHLQPDGTPVQETYVQAHCHPSSAAAPQQHPRAPITRTTRPIDARRAVASLFV